MREALREPVEVLARGENVVASSDGLQGEALGARGWHVRFSHYGQAPDEA